MLPVLLRGRQDRERLPAQDFVAPAVVSHPLVTDGRFAVATGFVESGDGAGNLLLVRRVQLGQGPRQAQADLRLPGVRQAVALEGEPVEVGGEGIAAEVTATGPGVVDRNQPLVDEHALRTILALDEGVVEEVDQLIPIPPEHAGDRVGGEVAAFERRVGEQL
jgi:hypothetical protein